MNQGTSGIAGPYLSVVVTTRNDDHGGDPLKRLQAFVNTFDAQCRRTGLDAEVVVVEWNPPADRQRLHRLVRMPPHCSFTLRFVEVPAELHRQLPYGDVLPLFQMIGKNVGVRRARGRFVLCTNIDIIFSNELVAYLASGGLSPDCIYRVDRHDIHSDFPVDGTLEEQMSYCRTHQLRLHSRDGTSRVDDVGRVTALEPDIVVPPVVTLGSGWHVREGAPAFGYYRWAGREAHLLVDRTAAPGLDRGVVLGLDLEPNAYQPGSWIDIEVLDGGRRLARRRFSRASVNVTRLQIALPDDVAAHEIVLKVVASSGGREHLPLFERREDLLYRLWNATLTVVPMLAKPLHAFDIDGWQRAVPTAQLTIDREAAAATVVTDADPFSYGAKFGPLQVREDGIYDFVLRYLPVAGEVGFDVMDGTTGRWMPGSRLEILQDSITVRTASTALERGQKIWLFVSNHHPEGRGVSRAVIHGLHASVPREAFRARFDLEAVGRSVRGWLARSAHRYRRVQRRMRDSLTHRIERMFGITRTGPVPVVSHVAEPVDETMSELRSFGDFLTGNRPAHVHQNACGDFQLMARERWFDLRGYAEFTMYSMNIDGLLEIVAHYAGLREQVLEMPLCIYHMEHEKGSGWTPEGEALLKKRIAESGITWLDARSVHIWGVYMAWLKRPMIFNGSNWGFGDTALPETILQRAVDNV